MLATASTFEVPSKVWEYQYRDWRPREFSMNSANYKYTAYSPEEEHEMTERTTHTSEDSPATTASKIGKTILWTSLGLAVVMGAIFAGLTLRARRWRNRTPYESFSHAGDNLNGGAE